MADIRQESQRLNPSAIIDLFTVDTSNLGGMLFYFVQGSKHNGTVKFAGVDYYPIDIEFEGLETSSAGSLPTPTVRVSNTDGIAQAMVKTWGDLLGCRFYRLRTFARHLDDGEEPDGEAFYGPDIFRFERKTSENSIYIEWELSAAIDQEGKQLPGRVIIRNTCLWRYRYFNAKTNKFDYSKAQCPYAGNQYFDRNDLPVTHPKDDEPSRRLSCCRARFGKGNPLPFGGFPGAKRLR